MKTLAIVQARMGSTRFPNKVMKQIHGVPMIEILLERLSKAERVDQIILATSNDSRNQPLVDHVQKIGYSVFTGSEDNVLERYFQAAKPHQPDYVVRITGDCPLTDPSAVDEMISTFVEAKVDYLNNNTFPDGLDVEVFTFAALERASKEASKPFEREHVTPYIRESGNFTIQHFQTKEDLSTIRLSVDEPEDFEVVTNVFNHFHPRRDFGWKEIIELYKNKPELFVANQSIKCNEGQLLGTGQKLWKRAKRVIPGGNMLLSKRPEMFLPDYWPSYYNKVQGVDVWNLDGNHYIDMAHNGIGSCILGGADPDVDAAVKSAIENGSMSTLNCPEEVELAELLCEIHSWADMVRFARTGGEAMSIAVRIARAKSKKSAIAFCGYHGWHDWYLSANLSHDEALVGHLLPGLSPHGIPRELTNTVFPFRYNQIDDLKKIVAQHGTELAAIVMEPIRNIIPEENFLQNVRDIASENNVVFIFDEITSGFRLVSGGAHLKFGVNPDMAVFAKAMSNGYPMAAIIGIESVMQAAQESFISSTYWTERIGPTAALAMIKKHIQNNVGEQLCATGKKIKQIWCDVANKTGFPLHLSGIDPLAHFEIDHEDALAVRTLFTQWMLDHGFLATNAVYTTFAHQDKHLQAYEPAVTDVFTRLKHAIDTDTIHGQLKGPVAHAGFRRLT